MNIAPWVEKFRPNKFDDIVLEPTNKQLLKNIIKNNNFPNLLFYGPPGTGKTTTIINLIEEYQKKYKQKRKGLKIHLNASDDRGIDIIRNQINQFVNTKTLFGDGIKFVILDEVDYMTKNAQQALRYLIQQYNKNIRFVLICNYISKIDSALQNEFIRLRFCQLPKKDTYNFLNTIIQKENLKITTKQINIIQKKFKSDIRSMINYIQSNHTNLNFNTDILSKKFLEKTLNNIKKKANSQEILQIFNKNNIEIKDFINELVLYIINEKVELLNQDFINSIQIIVHSEKVNNLYLLNYLVGELDKLYKE